MLALALVLAACADPNTRAYRPFQTRIGPDGDRTFSTAVAVAEAGGWVVEEEDAQDRRLVAVRLSEGTRDVLALAVHEDGAVDIDIRTEIEAERGVWLGAEVVCKSYDHTRERTFAAELADSVALRVARAP
jgi:hypothetical protein